jgi:hypothetical protein
MIAGENILLIARRRLAYTAYTAKKLAENMLGLHKTWTPHKESTTPCIVEDGCLLSDVIISAHAGGEAHVIRIVTERGRAISVTPTHTMLTPQGCRRAYELAEQDAVTIAPWPRRFGYLTPGVERDPAQHWNVFPRKTEADKIAAIVDVGFADVYDFDLEYPFNNYAANEFVVSSG